MNYLITAAGRGTRFLNEGIKPPKPLIKVLGNELLIWSLRTFDFRKEDKLFETKKMKNSLKMYCSVMYVKTKLLRQVFFLMFLKL